jgi:hypothetical protein
MRKYRPKEKPKGKSRPLRGIGGRPRGGIHGNTVANL